MSPPRRRTTVLLALVAGTLPLVATGCGAGGNATTQNFYAPADGLNVVQNDIRVLNALVVGSKEGGGEGKVSMVIANDGTQDETLRAISSDVGPVEVVGPRQIEAKSLLGFATPTSESEALIRNLPRKAGESVTLTLEFERAGAVRNLKTIIVPPDAYYRGFDTEPTARGTSGAEASPAAPPSPTAGYGGGAPNQGQGSGIPDPSSAPPGSTPTPS